MIRILWALLFLVPLTAAADTVAIRTLSSDVSATVTKSGASRTRACVALVKHLWSQIQGKDFLSELDTVLLDSSQEALYGCSSERVNTGQFHEHIVDLTLAIQMEKRGRENVKHAVAAADYLLEKEKALDEEYNALVDKHNALVGRYNAQLESYRRLLADYNRAIDSYENLARTVDRYLASQSRPLPVVSFPAYEPPPPPIHCSAVTMGWLTTINCR